MHIDTLDLLICGTSKFIIQHLQAYKWQPNRFYHLAQITKI